jgi:diaminopimelate epimerase
MKDMVHDRGGHQVMKFNFWKMHGARNDFVLFDNRSGSFPVEDRVFIAHIAARHSGIGAEGVILLEPSETCDFRMHFFNPDGGEAEMCGNGARCAALLAFELELAGQTMSIETAAGRLRAEVFAENVRLWMTDPTDWRMDGALDLEGRTLTFGFVNSGVPHVVMRTGNVQDVDVMDVGSRVRRHREFAPQGTNVNFMQVLPEGDLAVRTYERGVEAETPACGTGVTACALVAARNGWAKLPVRVHTRSGARLMVDGDLTEETVCNVTLTGPAEYVFEGTIEYRITSAD